MKFSSISLAAIAAVMLSTAALADHNSANGAGWANMPNDVHNIQIEDDISSTEFRDLVSQGGVSELDNRYDTEALGSGSGNRAAVASGSGRRR